MMVTVSMSSVSHFVPRRFGHYAEMRLLAMWLLSAVAVVAQNYAVTDVEVLNRKILAHPDAGLLRTRAHLLRQQIVRHPGQAAKAIFALPDLQRLRGVASASADLEVQESAITRTVIIADSANRSTATQIYVLDTA